MKTYDMWRTTEPEPYQEFDPPKDEEPEPDEGAEAMTKADLKKWEALGYAAGLVNRDPRPPEHGMVAAMHLEKAKNAYKAGWWRGFAVYQQERSPFIYTLERIKR